MVEHILNGNGSPLAPKPNLDLYLAIPAVHNESMSDEDWEAECERMFRQSKLARQFVDGQISPRDFEDGLANLGHNPYLLEEIWDEGTSLLYL